jgi:hypothetical protein
MVQLPNEVSDGLLAKQILSVVIIVQRGSISAKSTNAVLPVFGIF